MLEYTVSCPIVDSLRAECRKLSSLRYVGVRDRWIEWITTFLAIIDLISSPHYYKVVPSEKWLVENSSMTWIHLISTWNPRDSVPKIGDFRVPRRLPVDSINHFSLGYRLRTKRHEKGEMG